MGWSSGVDIFDDVVTALIKDKNIPDKSKIAIAKQLRITLEDGDWDTQCDSFYWDDELIGVVFADLKEEDDED